MPTTRPITIIQGGQYGSEAKGAIAAYLALKENPAYCVRTGATNAGHTVWYKGTRFAMQQLPVGWVNPNTNLVLGAGALIDLDILRREIGWINDATGIDVRSRLWIDPRAYVHLPHHRNRSANSGRHYLMGATGKGCSEVLMERIANRGPAIGKGSNYTVGNYLEHIDSPGADDLLNGIGFFDTEDALNNAYDRGARIHLEGTQGQLLDLYLGPYPYTTHKQTGPAQWMLECGLSPSLQTDIVMVVRTYPIRVAGNSGPLPNEIGWTELADTINKKRAEAGLDPLVRSISLREFEAAVREHAKDSKYQLPVGSDGLDQHLWDADFRATKGRIALSELYTEAWRSLPEATAIELSKLFEITTVTKKLRRIAKLDLPTLAVAARQCRPSRVAVTFMNYYFPQRWYSIASQCAAPYDERELMYLNTISYACKAPVTMLSRGPWTEHVAEVQQ